MKLYPEYKLSLMNGGQITNKNNFTMEVSYEKKNFNVTDSFCAYIFML